MCVGSDDTKDIVGDGSSERVCDMRFSGINVKAFLSIRGHLNGEWSGIVTGGAEAGSGSGRKRRKQDNILFWLATC